MKLNTLLIAAVACIGALVSAEQTFAEGATKEKKAKGGKFADLSVAELQAAVKEGKVTVIDANAGASYKKAHVPGAIHWAAVKSDLASALPKDKDALIVAYCGGPKCGAWMRPAMAAKKLGYTNIKHMKVGISGWKEAKAEVESGDKATKKDA
ncbi:hypothetical protein NT6N_05870 [Oceaniferula spumae]|uniref:Rhodanese domain-containing protein n=1 Tax=Oceaniferula spumae TaxID=2979115 RepID=A0AAT9FHT3_9BACT